MAARARATRVREAVPRPALDVLLDTSVLLDVFLARAPWHLDAQRLLSAADLGRVRGHVALHTPSTVYYVVTKFLGRRAATTAVHELLGMLRVVEMGTADYRRALTLGLADFEDALQVAACLRAGIAYLATRDAAGFKGAPVSAHAPAEILALLDGR